MITLEEILKVHQFSIQGYGGKDGVRTVGALEAAIARPFQTFDNEELYPTLIEKAAGLAESIIINHPFVDGNKRTGFLSMVAFIESHDYVFSATQEEAYSFIIDVSTGAIRFEKMVEWLQKKVVFQIS